MIYLVSRQQELFPEFTPLSVEASLRMMEPWKIIQFDTETSGRDAHICDLLCAQFGNDEYDAQIVVDCTTIDIRRYKNLLETHLILGQNLKFDLQFLFKYDIKPRRIYDTMLVEQMLYMGYPGKDKGGIGFGLRDIAKRRLHIDIDKTVRGEIIWRGLDSKVIIYAAGDVTPLEKIMHSQWADCIERHCTVAAQLESQAVPAMAYLEWSGIYLNPDKWKEKMKKDSQRLTESKKTLDSYIIAKLPKYAQIDLQGDLFEGFNTDPKCTINWDASAQVSKVCQELGFNTKFIDKASGEEKDTVLEKELSTQKGIDDEFLNLYFSYKEASKIVGTYGQGHLDLINPITGRLHTVFKQIGAATGRMSSGGGENKELTVYKRKNGYPISATAKFVNMQQLPHDAETRACFCAMPGNKFVSCDFSAEESRLGADVYDDTEMRKEFTERTGDTHAMFAWAVFHDECVKCGCTSAMEVKKKAKPWRDKVKSVEFAYLFGAAAPTIAKSAGCSVEQAQQYIDKLDKFFAGRTAFCKKGSAFVRKNGYVLVNPITGHRVTWWDFPKWQEEQRQFDSPGFWDNYSLIKQKKNKAVSLGLPPNTYLTPLEVSSAERVTKHFQVVSKYDRYALNSPTQGTGAIIMKDALTTLFNYICDNNYFDKIKLCVVVHDEINCEYPEELTDFPNVLSSIMSESAAKYCHSLPIPASPEVGDFWIH